MDNNRINNHLVAVIGAGPAGLFAARELANHGVHVVLFNRDMKPGGLAEYGIYPDKHRLKEGLRKQFRQVLALENLDYYGNIMIGLSGDLSLDELREMGFQALLVTAGAQGTKWLGLPGEELSGVYHAKDIVYHYNLLPPFSHHPYQIGKRVAIVGVGNVMTDIARFLICTVHVDEVIAIARRGPGEIKFDRAELEAIGANLDLKTLFAEIDANEALMRSIDQDPEKIKGFISQALEKAAPAQSDTRFTIRFLLSPTRILGDEQGKVAGLEVEHNTLTLKDGYTKARGLGEFDVLDVDTVIFAIGDQVDGQLGLPVQWNEFCKNPNPCYPIEGISYEVYDPQTCQPIPGVFVAGWSRQASTGLVGVAHKDGVYGARAILQYLEAQPPAAADVLERLKKRLGQVSRPVVDKADMQRLDAIERERAGLLGVPEFKFSSNEEMLEVLGRSSES